MATGQTIEESLSRGVFIASIKHGSTPNPQSLAGKATTKLPTTGLLRQIEVGVGCDSPTRTRPSESCQSSCLTFREGLSVDNLIDFQRPTYRKAVPVLDRQDVLPDRERIDRWWILQILSLVRR